MDSLAALLEQQYAALTDKQRVIVLHPNYAQQHLILRLLPAPCVYVRFGGSAKTAAQLEAQVNDTLVHFGHKLKTNDLVVLDEADRAEPNALRTLVVDVLLPQVKRGRVVLLSRRVPTELLADERLQGQIVLIPRDPERMLLDYAQPEDLNQRRLEVWALGGGRVLIDGKAVETWDGVLPRSLFFYLVDRGMTTRAEIFSTFWPALSTKDATNVFHVTKRKISEVLGTDLTVFRSGFYHLSPHIHLVYDVSIFNSFVQESSIADKAEALSLLGKAVAMYRASFIHSLQTPWANQRRSEIEQSYGDALMALARVLEQDDKPEVALSHYLRATALQIPREDAMERVLQLSGALGSERTALAAYRRFEQMVRAELKIAPSPALQALAEQIGKSLD